MPGKQISSLLLKTKRDPIAPPAPLRTRRGRKPSGLTEAAAKALETPSSQGGHPAPRSQPPALEFYPRDLSKNKTTHRKAKREKKPRNKTSVAQLFSHRSKSAGQGPSASQAVLAAPSKDGGHRRSRSLPRAAGCPASHDHSRGALHAPPRLDALQVRSGQSEGSTLSGQPLQGRAGQSERPCQTKRGKQPQQRQLSNWLYNAVWSVCCERACVLLRREI